MVQCEARKNTTLDWAHLLVEVKAEATSAMSPEIEERRCWTGELNCFGRTFLVEERERVAEVEWGRAEGESGVSVAVSTDGGRGRGWGQRGELWSIDGVEEVGLMAADSERGIRDCCY